MTSFRNDFERNDFEVGTVHHGVPRTYVNKQNIWEKGVNLHEFC